MRAKEILILIFLIVAGVTFTFLHEGKISIDGDFDGWFFSSSEGFSFEESQAVELPLPASMKVINSHGSVEVQGGEESQIQFTFLKKIWRKTEDEAKEVSAKLKPAITREGDRLIISTTRDEFQRKNFETSFKIRVPSGMDVEVINSYGLVKTLKLGKATIANRHGEVSAFDIKGPLSIKNSYEDIEVENVESNCDVQGSHADMIVRSVKGETKITQAYGKIQLENCSLGVEVRAPHSEIFAQDLKGPVHVQNSYEKISLVRVGPAKIFGHHSAVELDGAAGNVEIQSSYDRVDVRNIQGSLNISGRNMDVFGKGVNGAEILISTSYENVELADFSGKTTIVSSHGDIVLRPAPLTLPIEVKSAYANITLYWPSQEKYPVEARTRNGNIDWKLAAAPDYEEKNGTTAVKAFLGEKDKPSLFLSTSYGDIRIEESLIK